MIRIPFIPFRNINRVLLRFAIGHFLAIFCFLFSFFSFFLASFGRVFPFGRIATEMGLSVFVLDKTMKVFKHLL